MARYIDADALIKKMFPLGIGDGIYTINAKAVKFAIDKTPTADVVPKSEVERLETENFILKQKRITLFDRLDFVKRARAEAIKEFAERLHNLFDVDCEKTHGGIDNVLQEMTEGRK